MNFRKITAGLTAAAVTAVLSISASAALVEPNDPASGLEADGSKWLIQLYNTGIDYGIDYASVAKVSFTLKAIDNEWFDGGMGGAVAFSVNGGDIAQGTDLWNKYNWMQHDFWGVNDEELEIVTMDEGKPLQSVKVGDHTYELSVDVYNDNPLHNGDASEIGCMQVWLGYWGSDLSDYDIVSFNVYDNAGKVLLSFDKNGRQITAGTAAPATGDVAAATDSSKGSPDTGIEDVAVIAGLAVLAGGAAVVAGRKAK